MPGGLDNVPMETPKVLSNGIDFSFLYEYYRDICTRLMTVVRSSLVWPDSGRWEILSFL